MRARDAHRRATEAEQLAEQYREERDRLICALRASDPERWTYKAIAAAVGQGCSPELVAAIVKGRTRRAR